MKKKQRSREFWEKAVEFTEASSLTQGQCAQKLGVGHYALSYWQCKLRRERRERSEKGALVPVKVLKTEPVAAMGLELDLNDGRLRFSEQTSAEYIASLARAIRQC